MTPTTEHLKQVQQAAARLEASKREFRMAIRQAVAAGASVRTVGAAAGLGKSRVHVIARKGGGSE